jgi:hypothetical protein
MGFRKREPLFSVLLDTGLHLLDSLRDRLAWPLRAFRYCFSLVLQVPGIRGHGFLVHAGRCTQRASLDDICMRKSRAA